MATLQEALDEAYASATSDKIPLHAMELNHPAFTAPLRLIRWPVSGPDLTVFKCRHEVEAELDPALVVEYHGFPYEIILPESSQNTEGAFKFKVSLYNDFDDQLKEAALTPGVIRATYREYVKGKELEGPVVTWPGITIASPRREGADIVADGVILRWMTKPYGGLYLPTDYPGLVTGR